jgi:hypothetical protein
MVRRLLQLLMLVIVAQSTLAAADAHVLHEVSGEASHQHLMGKHNQSAHAPSAPADHGSADEQNCQHHCCHGHNFKYLNDSMTFSGMAPERLLGWGRAALYAPPTVAPESRPPIG